MNMPAHITPNPAQVPMEGVTPATSDGNACRLLIGLVVQAGRRSRRALVRTNPDGEHRCVQDGKDQRQQG